MRFVSATDSADTIHREWATTKSRRERWEEHLLATMNRDTHRFGCISVAFNVNHGVPGGRGDKGKVERTRISHPPGPSKWEILHCRLWALLHVLRGFEVNPSRCSSKSIGGLRRTTTVRALLRALRAFLVMDPLCSPESRISVVRHAE